MEEQHTPPPLAHVPMTPPTERGQLDEFVSQIPIDEAGRVAQSVACRACGYDLQGLPAEAACPECGTPIDRSLTPDRLMFANPQWLARVARGIGTMLLGFAATFAISIIGSVALGILAAQGQGMNVTAPMAVMTILTVACGLVVVLGGWWATTLEPGVHEDKPVNARTLARYCILAQVLSGAINFSFNAGNPMVAPAALTNLQVAGAVFGAVLGMVSVVGYVALMLYMGRLASRLPSRTLASQHRIVAWGLGVTQALALVFGIVMVLAIMPLAAGAGGGGGGGGGAVAAGGAAVLGVAAIGGCIVGLSSLVFGVWAIVLGIIMWSRLRSAAELARQAWAD